MTRGSKQVAIARVFFHEASQLVWRASLIY